jgi:hypothetical protein
LGLNVQVDLRQSNTKFYYVNIKVASPLLTRLRASYGTVLWRLVALLHKELMDSRQSMEWPERVLIMGFLTPAVLSKEE